ncbi:monovalent cation/H+ antiporter subunit A [Rhodoligotrophos ferricapiens]|uniref:monovalent cation/H+ antiporter subunit A n=1 Tax=Rhodoligotrophos ferricapiens TaxID=3069264 RepID=UPI00315C6CD9
MPEHALLIAILILPFAGSLIAGFLTGTIRNAEAWLAGAISLAGLGAVAALYPTVAKGEIIRAQMEWLPSLGLNFSLRMDGFAWMFSVLITGIGLLVVVYSRYYMSQSDPRPRFFAFFLGFMGSMLGIVLSGNLIQLVLFWELTSLFSFLLIGYWYQNANAREGARMALTVTATGGLSLFAGVILLGYVTGSYELDRVLAAGDLVRGHHLYLPILLLVLFGGLTKSAQFPFHFWLPRAMAAPTPVSAYLHSATMVKAGVFLLARLWPVLSGTDAWFWTVGSFGLATFLVGAYLAIFQQDLKGLLAYSTISHLGLITLMLGLGSPLSAVAAIFHMINHATFKASLFMGAGIVDHETGTRDIRRLSGLYRAMPISATMAMVAAAAMAGVPLLNGFLSKEMFFAETVENHDGSVLDAALPYVVTLASMFSVTYSLRFILGVFFGPPPTDLPRVPHEPPRWMRFPTELLVLICLLVGIVPSLTVGPFLATAVHAVLGSEMPAYSLSPWHGFNLPLLMSAVAMVGGALLYLLLQGHLQSGVEGPPFLYLVKGQRFFERALVVLSWRWARSLEQLLGTRRLQPQLLLLMGLALLAGAAPVLVHGASFGNEPLSPVDPAFIIVWLIGLTCALGTAYQAKYHRLAALILLGGAGLATCVTFVWLSAPDLALTQLLVEIVTIVLFLLGLRWLPKRIRDVGDLMPDLAARWRRLRDFAIAVGCGGGLGLLAYAIMTRPRPDGISSEFVRRAYSEGGGTNVVNVILVDFRGFDTLGEIVVLGAVALIVYALLRRFRPAPDSINIPEQQRIQNDFDAVHPERQTGDTIVEYLTIPAVLMRGLFPVIAVLALYLLLRGHDMPGGGFVAGLTMAVAFILQYIAGGTRWVETRLRVLPVRWIAAGLLLACFTGAAAWLFGYPFLTSYFTYGNLGLLGKVPLASAMAFDIGVFALVVGATVLILIALGHQSIRSQKQARAAQAVEETV